MGDCKFKPGDITIDIEDGEIVEILGVDYEHGEYRVRVKFLYSQSQDYESTRGISHSDRVCVLHPESIIDRLLEKYK